MKLTLSNGVAAAVLLAAGTAAADDVGKMERGAATRFDRSGMTISELAAEYAKRQPARVAPEVEMAEIANRLPATVQDSVQATVDPLLTGRQTAASPVLGVSFDGPTSDDNANLNGFRVQPPDTNGDVGLNQVVSYPNVLYEVALKDGTVQGTFPGNALFFGFGGPCESDGFESGGAGDYVVLYDEGRWVYKGWAPNFGIECIAITDGEDALGPVTRYEFQVVPPGTFNDYPKFGVWVDETGGQSAYTLTERNFAVGFEISAYVIDRDAIRAGDPAPTFFRQTNLSSGNPDGIMPGHIDNVRVPAGKCPLFAVAFEPNEYRFWEFCEDFENNTASFRSLPSIPVATFDNDVTDVPLPGGDNVDTLSFFTAFQTVSSTIDGQHQVAFAHTVDLGGERAGLRWAILDADDYDNIGIIDTGTFGPNDGLERWMSSPAFDQLGNFAIAYTRGGNGTFPGVAFTGRETTDPSGQLQQEVTCVDGTGSQTGGGGRWGDYSSLALDPADGCTFWAFQEYVAQTGSFEWDTRICSFSFPSCSGVQPTDFTLSVSPGQAGVANDFTTVNGTEGGAVVLYLGRNAGSTAISLGQCATTVDIANARLIGFGTDGDSDGSVTISRNIPGQAGGLTLLTQAVDLRGCETSNVDATTY
jgi:hypothetical protein